MNERLKRLLENNAKLKKKSKKRKLGNTTKVWTKKVLTKATIEVD